jgi:hypothetical protein
MADLASQPELIAGTCGCTMTRPSYIEAEAIQRIPG